MGARANASAPRAAGAAAWDGVRVVYAGGVGDGVVGDVYALAGDGWEAIGVMAEPREHLAATSDLAGRTWLLGGRVGGLTANLGTVELVEVTRSSCSAASRPLGAGWRHSTSMASARA